MSGDVFSVRMKIGHSFHRWLRIHTVWETFFSLTLIFLLLPAQLSGGRETEQERSRIGQEYPAPNSIVRHGNIEVYSKGRERWATV